MSSIAIKNSSGAEVGWSRTGVLALLPLLLIIETLTIQFGMLGIALPRIAAYYGTSQVAWSVTAAAITGAAVAPIIGKLADIYGKRRMLFLICAVSTVGFLVSAAAPTFGLFVLGRVLSGTLLCAPFVSYSLIRDVFPLKIVPMASGLANSGTAVIAILGPIAAGWTLGIGAGVPATMFLLGALTAGSAVTLLLLTPETTARARSSIDYVSALLMTVGVTAVLLGLSQGQSSGWASALVLSQIVGGFIILAVWSVYSLRARHPLVDLRFFFSGSMAGIALCALLVSGALTVVGILLPLVVLTPPDAGLGYGLGLSSSGFAAVLIPQLSLAMVGGIVSGKIASKYRTVNQFLGALGCLTVGFAGLAFFHSSITTVVAFASLQGFGQGLALATIALLIFRAVPVDRQAQMASTTGVVGGLAGAAMPILLYMVLNSNAVVLGDVVGYTDAGIRNSYLMLAGVAALAVVCAAGLLLPRRPEEEEAALASDLALRGGREGVDGTSTGARRAAARTGLD